MATLDIKDLTTTEMVELMGKLEKEIEFRKNNGKESEDAVADTPATDGSTFMGGT